MASRPVERLFELTDNTPFLACPRPPKQVTPVTAPLPDLTASARRPAIPVSVSPPLTGRPQALRPADTAVPPEQALGWAVGTRVVTTPDPARVAERILTAATARAGLPAAVLADVMLAASRGLHAPAHGERALRRAVQAARTPHTATTAPGPSTTPAST